MSKHSIIVLVLVTYFIVGFVVSVIADLWAEMPDVKFRWFAIAFWPIFAIAMIIDSIEHFGLHDPVGFVSNQIRKRFLRGSK